MYNYYVLDKLNSNIIGLLDKPEICNNSYIFYHIKSKTNKIFFKDLYKLKSIPKLYDLIVIGGGPSGIGTVCEYMKEHKEHKDLKVLLIEKGNSSSLSEYPFTDVDQWMLASYTPENSQYYQTLQVGKGLGGGSRHFGLQYIEDIIRFPLVDLDILRNQLRISQYDYSNNFLSYELHNIKTTLEKNKNFKVVNNYLYADKGNQKKRVLYSTLLKSLKNLDILCYSEVQFISHSLNQVTSINLHKHIYRANQYVLACGALGTPELLLRNGLINKGLYNLHDHIGFTIVYENPNFKLYDEYRLGHLQARDLNDYWQVYFSLLPEFSISNPKYKLVVTFATSRLLNHTKPVNFSLDSSNNLKIEKYSTDNGETYGSYKSHLHDAFNKIHPELTNLGFLIYDNGKYILKSKVEEYFEEQLQKSSTIYHYQSTLADKVVKPVKNTDIFNNTFNDIKNFRLKDLPKNLSVADLSIYGTNFQHIGSTTAVAYACGTTLGKLLKKQTL